LLQEITDCDSANGDNGIHGFVHKYLEDLTWCFLDLENICM